VGKIHVQSWKPSILLILFHGIQRNWLNSPIVDDLGFLLPDNLFDGNQYNSHPEVQIADWMMIYGRQHNQ
jgi:hypothetical protein